MMDPIKINTESLATEAEKASIELFDGIIKTGCEEFMEDGSMSPMVFIGLEETEKKITVAMMPAGDFMNSVESKDLLADILRRVGQGNPLFIAMAFEAWFAKEEANGRTSKEVLNSPTYVPPSERPDREEALMFNIETENLMRSKIFIIKRDPLALEEGHRDVKGYEGRFANVLRNMKKMREN